MNKHALAVALLLSMTSFASAKTVGVSMRLFDDNYVNMVLQSIQKQAATDKVAVQAEDAQGDVGKQISQIQNFVAQKVDAIIVCAVDTSATPQLTRLATNAGIPIVYVTLRPEGPDQPKTAVFVGSDDRVSGKLQGEEVARRLHEKGNVVIIQGDLSNNSAIERTQYVEEDLARYPGIKITEKQSANWSRVQANDLMSNWLTRGQTIDAVVANNDEMAIGAVQAITQSGKDPKQFVIGGVDATADALAEIKKGSMAFSVFQDAARQGEQALKAALKLANHEPVDQTTWVPFQLVTSKNLDQFQK